MELTIEQDVSKQVLALAASELRRLESINDSWQGAYISMRVADGDAIGRRINCVGQTLVAISRDFPKGHWIVYLQPSIHRFGKATIMAFSKQDLRLVYFGSVNDPR